MYAAHFNELSPGKQFPEICPDATLREAESRARIHGIMAGLRCRLLLTERLYTTCKCSTALHSKPNRVQHDQCVETGIENDPVQFAPVAATLIVCDPVATLPVIHEIE
jgi:hypothetical protein